MEGELQRVVGRNVRRIRIGRGASQEELADEIGVHRTYMGGVERGERNLTLRSVERLAAGLGVEPGALLTEPAETGETAETGAVAADGGGGAGGAGAADGAVPDPGRPGSSRD